MTAIIGVIAILSLLVQYSDAKAYSVSNEESDGYPDWVSRGKADLEAALNSWPNWKPATNVVMFIGDGMGISTLSAARLYKAQYQTGESVFDTTFSWEQFPTTGIIKTYSTDQQATDSAASANAMLCGEKTRAEMIAINQKVSHGDCLDSLNNTLKSMLHHAIDDGKWTGIITTSRITDATPASSYAHSPNRNWVTDVNIPEEYKGMCQDIASQLVDEEYNQQIRVILAGGRRDLFPVNTTDPESGEPGRRHDGRYLTEEWIEQRLAMGASPENVHYIEKLSEFDEINFDQEEYLLGLFAWEHMEHDIDRREQSGEWQEPSLAAMVRRAIQMLQRGPQGFFLLVEGARIDSAHHANNAYRALSDTVALDEAVEIARNLTSEDDTLIVVTADHSHPFTIAGDAALDNDIFGISILRNETLQTGRDNKTYTALGYHNGPGYWFHKTVDGNLSHEIPRINLTGVDTSDVDYRQDSTVPRASATHSGEDVALYASGPMSHLLSGQHEQSYIAYAVRYAACLGDNKEMCEDPRPPPECQLPVPGGSDRPTGLWVLFMSIIFAILHKIL